MISECIGGLVKMSRICELFDDVCGKYPMRTAVVYREGMRVKRKDFGGLHEDVSAMTAYLHDCGVRRGDRILAFAPSSYRLCVFMLASLRIGAPIMYVDIWARQESIADVFGQYRPSYVLVSDATRLMRPFFGEIGRIAKTVNIDRFEKYSGSTAESAEISEDETALHTMTTGSTGKPKIALRSHRDLLCQLELINMNIISGGHETVLTTSYIYVFANILNGFTTVMPSLNLGRYSSRKINRILNLFRDEAVSMIITSPDYCLKADNIFHTLKVVYSGGAILNLHEARIIREKYSGCTVRIIYGSTECSIIAQADIDEFTDILEKTHRSILGRPVDGVDVRLADNGEILVSARALLKDYLVSDNSTKTIDSEGRLWHHTNDIAQYENGLLYFLGKSGRYINTSDGIAFSNCTEQAIISAFPDIPKCAVLEHDGGVYVFLQRGVKPHTAEELNRVLSDFGIQGARFRTVRKIPCDVKHHTKIDYNRLKRYIKS